MTIKLFLFFSFFLFVSAQINIIEDCTYHGCDSLSIAKTCGKINECIINEWSHLKFSPALGDYVCSICVEMIRELKNEVTSPNFVSSTLKYLMSGCSVFKYPSAVDMCFGAAHSLAPEILRLISSSISPQNICHVLSLCNNVQLRKEQSESDECVSCLQLIALTTDYVTRSSEPDLTKHYTNICRSMGSYSDACIYTLLQNPNTVFNVTKKILYNKPCEVLRLCPVGSSSIIEETVHRLSHQSVKDSKKQMCEMCPIVLGNLHEFMSNKKLNNKLIEWSVELCTSLGYPKDFCFDFVQDNYKVLDSHFQSNMSYDYICKRGLGFCLDEFHKAPVWPLLPSNNNYQIRNMTNSEKKTTENIGMEDNEGYISKGNADSNTVAVRYLLKEHVSKPPTQVNTTEIRILEEKIPKVAMHSEGTPVKNFSKVRVSNLFSQTRTTEMRNFQNVNIPVGTTDSYTTDDKNLLKEATLRTSTENDEVRIFQEKNIPKVTTDRDTIEVGNSLKKFTSLSRTTETKNYQNENISEYLTKHGSAEVRTFTTQGSIIERQIPPKERFRGKVIEKSNKKKKEHGKVTIKSELTTVKIFKTDEPEKVTDRIDAAATKPLARTKNEAKIDFGDPITGVFQPLPENRMLGANNAKCLACTSMFNDMSRLMVENKKSVDVIFNSTCGLINGGENCKEFVENYGHLINNPSLIAPERICPVLVPMCEVNSNAPLLRMVSLNFDENCNFCMDLFSMSNNTARRNSIEDTIVNNMKELCIELSRNNNKMCDKVAETFTTNMVASITSSIDEKQACGHLNMCKIKEEMPVAPKKKFCAICLIAVESIYDELKNKTNEEEIKKVLESVCNSVPKSDKDFCKSMIDQYTDQLIKLIVSNLTPSEVCRELTLCDRNKSLYMWDLDIIKNTKHKVPCSFCLAAMKMVLKKLENNKTEEAITNTLRHICQYMPGEVQDSCKTLIDEYSDTLVEMIMADFNESEICIFLKLCGPKASVFIDSLKSSLGFNIATNEVWRRYNPNGACYFCQLMERSLVVKGYDDKGADEMLGLLADVCLSNSENRYWECAKKFSEEILPVGKSALKAMSNICDEMKICQKDDTSLRDVGSGLLNQIRKAVEECAMCESVVSLVAKRIDKHGASYAFADNAVDVCSSVPSTWLNTCKTMVVSYSPSIVHLIKDLQVELDEVCFDLKLCDKSSQTKVNMTVTSIEQSGLKTRNDSKNCLKGPSFWCANVENAVLCKTLAHCKTLVWKGQLP